MSSLAEFYQRLSEFSNYLNHVLESNTLSQAATLPVALPHTVPCGQEDVEILYGVNDEAPGALVAPDNTTVVSPEFLPPCPPDCSGTCRLCKAYADNQRQKSRRHNSNYRNNLAGCGKKLARGGVKQPSPYQNCVAYRKYRNRVNADKRRRNAAKLLASTGTASMQTSAAGTRPSSSQLVPVKKSFLDF